MGPTMKFRVKDNFPTWLSTFKETKRSASASLSLWPSSTRAELAAIFITLLTAPLHRFFAYLVKIIHKVLPTAKILKQRRPDLYAQLNCPYRIPKIYRCIALNTSQNRKRYTPIYGTKLWKRNKNSITEDIIHRTVIKLLGRESIKLGDLWNYQLHRRNRRISSKTWFGRTSANSSSVRKKLITLFKRQSTTLGSGVV